MAEECSCVRVAQYVSWRREAQCFGAEEAIYVECDGELGKIRSYAWAENVDIDVSPARFIVESVLDDFELKFDGETSELWKVQLRR